MMYYYHVFCCYLQGADRAFLEELLVYLRQQRRQLDESRRLLEQLERQQGESVLPASHIGMESGTMPSATSGVSASGLGADYGEMSGHVGPTRVSASTQAARPGGRVDLSSLYEQREYMYTILCTIHVL